MHRFAFDHAFVLSSWEETLPLSILETPVVASEVDRIADQVEDGVRWSAFSHAQPEALGDALLRMYAAVNFRGACAKVGRARYNRLFAWAHYVECWKTLVEKP